LVAQKKRKGLAYIWRFHREVNPTQIVSLRVIEGYLSPEEPKFGSRWMVHALVKFDTEQVYQ
jgi:protein MBA1